MKKHLTTAQKQNKNINEPTTQPSQGPIIFSNNTMIMVSFAKMRVFNRCGSVRNDDISNLLLVSGVGPGVSIPCSYKTPAKSIDSICPNNHLRKKNHEKRQISQQIILYYLGLSTHNPELRVVDLEPNLTRGSDKINRLRPRRTRHPIRCNNRIDLPHLSLTSKISIFSEAYI